MNANTNREDRDKVLFVRLNAYEQRLVRQTAARRHQPIGELVRGLVRDAAAAAGIGTEGANQNEAQTRTTR